MIKLLIFPSNGNALEALDCLANDFECIGFIDDTKEKQGKDINGVKVYSRDVIENYQEAKILAVPGSPSSFLQRGKIIAGLKVSPDRFATIIHPAARIGVNVKLGYNLLIMPGVVITSNAIINNHVCILPNSVIHHDSEIGEYTLIGSQVTVAGNVKIAKNCYIGSGSSIIHGITIGEKTLIGMGSNVIRPLPAMAKAVGNPARVI